MLRHIDSSAPTRDSGCGPLVAADLSGFVAPAGTGQVKKQTQKILAIRSCCISATEDTIFAGDVQPAIRPAEATFAHPCVPLITLANHRKANTLTHIECAHRWARESAVAPTKDWRLGCGRYDVARPLIRGETHEDGEPASVDRRLPQVAQHHGSFPQMPDDLLGLAEAVNTLNKTFDSEIDYRKFYQQVVNGRIPAVRQRNRWYVSRGDFGHIAQVLGFAPPRPAAPDRPGKTTRSRAATAV